MMTGGALQRRGGEMNQLGFVRVSLRNYFVIFWCSTALLLMTILASS
jgi:hypothetical protein